MKAFTDILPMILQNIGIQRRYCAETVLLHWRKIVGDELANHTCPLKVQSGVLLVGTSNSVWSYHLITIKEEIITKINCFTGENVIRDIKFQAGHLKKDQNEENSNEKDILPINWKNEVLSIEDVHYIDNLTKHLSDKILRKKMKEILRRDLALRQAKRKKEWHGCSACGILCPPDREFCPACSVEKRAKEKSELIKLLVQAPWLNYRDCVQYVNCHSTEYNTAKNELIDSLRKKIDNNEADCLTISTLVMLINEVKPEAVTEELIAGTIEKIRRKKHVSAPRR